MNRRTLLKFGLGGLVLGSIGFVFRSPNQDLRDYVHRVITEHLKDGGLIAGGIDQFSNDIQHAPNINYKSKGLVFVLSKFTNAPDEIPAIDYLADFKAEFDRQMISDYLLSSDFFFEQKAPGATVNYMGYADRICNQANPFARFLDS